MKKNRTRHLWRSKIIINTCLLVVVPLLAVGGGFCLLYSRNVQRSLMTQNEDYLNVTEARLEQALTNVETQAAQWMKLNIGTQSSNESDSYAKDYLRLMWHVHSLEVLKNSNDWTERVIFSHGASGTLLDSEYGIVLLKDYRLKPLLEALYADNARTGWHTIPDRDGHSALLFVSQLPHNAMGTQDMLITVLSEAKLAAEINPLPRVIPGARFTLLDRSGKIFYPDPQKEKVLLPPDAHDLRPGTGSRSYRVDGADMVTTFAMGAAGWKLLATGPFLSVYYKAAWVWQMAQSIMGIGALLSVLCILIFSKWMYKPFQVLMNTFTRLSKGRQSAIPQVLDEVAYFQDTITHVQRENTAFMDRWQSVQQVVTQQYLQQLLRNGRYAALDTVPDALPQHSGAVVALMHLEAHSSGDSLLSDRPLAFSAIENIALELLEEYPHLCGYILAQYPKGFSLICFPARTLPEADVYGGMRAYLTHLKETLQHYLDIHISIGAGRLYENRLDASLSHGEALMAMRYQLLGTQGMEVCFYHEVAEDAQDISLRYPTQLEARIIAHLKDNRPDAARSDLIKFGQQIQGSGSYPFCRQAYLMLLAGIVQTLIKEERWADMVLGDDLFESLIECVTLQEMQEYLTDHVFQLFSRLQQEDGDSGTQAIVDAVQRFVQENIQGDLSLVQCAGAAGISASYLSRIFKRCCGTSFLEYVTGKKIDFVKERLCSTQESIGELAAQVGYSERSLYRIFIKLEGMSPGGYREKNQRQ